jgi:hypothetical protein
MSAPLVTLSLVGIFTIIIFCRFEKMNRHTSNRVALQYACNFAGVLGSAACYGIPKLTLGFEYLEVWVLAPVLAGMIASMALSAHRWANGPPADLQRARVTPWFRILVLTIFGDGRHAR